MDGETGVYPALIPGVRNGFWWYCATCRNTTNAVIGAPTWFVREEDAEVDLRRHRRQEARRPDMAYVAIVNVPGYLPDTEPCEFESPAEAWAFLADERRSDLVEADQDPARDAALDRMTTSTRCGCIHAPAPSSPRLGLAYCVTEATDLARSTFLNTTTRPPATFQGVVREPDGPPGHRGEPTTTQIQREDHVRTLHA